jgi:hypothetical protein
MEITEEQYERIKDALPVPLSRGTQIPEYVLRSSNDAHIGLERASRGIVAQGTLIEHAK